jgi:hypothetical protein
MTLPLMNSRDFGVAHIAGVDLVEGAATIGFVRSAAARETDPAAAVPATTQAIDLEAGGALRRLPQPFAHDHRQRYLEIQMLIENHLDVRFPHQDFGFGYASLAQPLLCCLHYPSADPAAA